MKKFIKNGFKLFAILMILNIVAVAITTPGYFMPYEQHEMNFSTYLLADSHGLAIGDSAEKFGIYNLSAASDAYSDMSRKLKYLIRNTDVNRVILTIDDHVLSPYRMKHNNNDRSVAYLSGLEIASNYKLIKEWIQRYILILNPKARDYLTSFLKSEVKDFLRKNSENESITWENKSLEERKNIASERYQLQFNYDQHSSSMRSHLIEIVKLCKEKNIEVIGLRYPLSRVYLELVKDDQQVLEVAGGLGIKILDFKRAFIDKPEYFLNQDHLNGLGGAELAKLINQKLL